MTDDDYELAEIDDAMGCVAQVMTGADFEALLARGAATNSVLIVHITEEPLSAIINFKTYEEMRVYPAPEVAQDVQDLAAPGVVVGVIVWDAVDVSESAVWIFPFNQETRDTDVDVRCNSKGGSA